MTGGRIPVSVITGFLGSGKTTLLNYLVRHPGMGETAVIVNEFGEIGLDHELIEKSDENTILLGSGCLCCTVRGDLVDTLGDLSVRRLKGEVPPFKRVVIETTGLADPAPILHTLMSVPVVGRYALDNVVTTVDIVNGSGTLLQHDEAVKQVAIADRLLMTKSDLCDARAAEKLATELREINPAAPMLSVVNGEIDPNDLFGSMRFDLQTKTDEVRDWLRAEQYKDEQSQDDDGASHSHDVNRHNDRIEAFCVTFSESLDWQTVAMWLDSLVANEGEKLLRVKGILDVRDIPEPLVIHAVQHLFHPPVRIKAWPPGSRESRIVFITRDLPRDDVEAAYEKAQRFMQRQSATG
ncbi:MAG: GTP-binding protein [Gammaproteobacteria bacterium]|nr:GTP-binding protein [Gammaproteobacteria bacterium]